MTAPDLWTVVHVDPVREHPRCADILAWVATLGVDVMTIKPAVNISQDAGDRSYRLHLSRFVVDEHGSKVIDHAARCMQSEPLVIPIDSLPAWLTDGGT